MGCNMLSNEELIALCDRHNVPPHGRQLIENILAADPSRRVQAGAKNATVRIASHKMGCVIQAESHKNEAAAVLQWEYDPTVLAFLDQPPSIKFTYNGRGGRRCTHLKTPDYFLVAEDFIGWVECKQEEELVKLVADGSGLFAKGIDGVWRCPPGEEYARDFGLGFRVRSSQENDWVRIRNLAFLSDYLDDDSLEADPKTEEVIIARFDSRPWINLCDLIENRSGEENDALYTLIAKRRLVCDLSASLLSEPYHCPIFRSEEAQRAFRIYESTATPISNPEIEAISLAVGSTIYWDGRHYRVLNPGSREVWVEDAEGQRQALQVEFINQLVREGKLTGPVKPADANNDRAEEILRSLGERDLARTLERYNALFPDAGLASEGPMPRPSASTLRRWKKMFRDGVKIYGSGFVGLASRLGASGNHQPKIAPAVQQVISEVIDAEWAVAGGKSKKAIWGLVCNACKARGLVPPSEKTFLAKLAARDSHHDTANREGARKAYSTEEFVWIIDRSTPRHGERPFEVGHIDHTLVEINLVGRQGEALHKPWLTILFDAYTRYVLAFVLTFDPPSYRSCMAVVDRCIRQHNRIPKTIVSDSGSEFEGGYYERLLAYLACNKKTRPKSKARFGSVCERWFGVSQQELVHSLKGNNRLLRDPRALSRTHDPRKQAVWTLEAFSAAFAGYIDEVYHRNEHGALGMSPKAALERGLAMTGMRAHRLIPYTASLRMMSLPSTRKGTAKVQPGRGVKIGYFYYWTASFREPRWHRQDVPVRYDPNDISCGWAYLGDTWTLCRSQYASILQGHSEREIAIISEEIRGKNSRTYTRRQVNAQTVARYLESTNVSQAVLLQQRRDAEFRNALGLDATAPSTSPALDKNGNAPAEPQTTTQDWEKIKGKLFGEFV